MFSVVTFSYRPKGGLRVAHDSIIGAMQRFPVEWIIVDDYSDDDGVTRAEIESLVQLGQIRIKPIYLQRNSFGASSAVAGATAASGEYLIFLDQDDRLLPAALSVYAEAISMFDSQPRFAGVCGRCIDSQGRIIGNPLPQSPFLSNELDIRYRRRVRGEMAQCIRRPLIISYFSGMRPGFTRGWGWYRMARDYQVVYVDEPVQFYNRSNPDAVSRLATPRYPEALYLQRSRFLVYNLPLLLNDWPSLLTRTVNLCRLAHLLGVEPKRLRHDVGSSIWGILPLAWVIAMLFPLPATVSPRDQLNVASNDGTLNVFAHRRSMHDRMTLTKWDDETIDIAEVQTFEYLKESSVLENSVRLLNDLFVRRIDRGVQLLEVGCGADAYVRDLCGTSIEWSGVDVIAFDRRGRKCVATKVGSVASLPWNTHYFDIVLSNQSIEHWFEYGVSVAAGLNEINRVLKPGGRVVVNFPIHLHGHPCFLKGDFAAIDQWFAQAGFLVTRRTAVVDSRQPTYKGWRLCRFPDFVVAGRHSEDTSYVVEYEARKISENKTHIKIESRRVGILKRHSIYGSRYLAWKLFKKISSVAVH